MFKFVFLTTDIALFAFAACLVAYISYVRQNPPLAVQWRRVFISPAGMSSAIVLLAMLGIALLDSIHYRTALPTIQGATQAYSPVTLSVLDASLIHLKAGQEKTYSAPFSTTQLTKETQQVDGKNVRDNPPLRFGGAHIRGVGQRGDLDADLVAKDITAKTLHGLILGAFIGAALCSLLCAGVLAGRGLRFKDTVQYFEASALPWRNAMTTIFILSVLACVLWSLSHGWHVLGTDRAGNDVLYMALKSIRTAMVIASLTLVASLPFAIVLGIAAGTLRGWVDSAIQYVYTVLSSIPGVLLIAACVLMIQSYIDKNPASYATALERADVKLFLLCMVLGLTSWAGLARLLRAEAMKLRELDFVHAARSFGVPKWRIMIRHIMPNTMYLLILTMALEFSALVLFEAVLSYIGIGVDPAIQSFGGMINAARTELARNPIIWWPLGSAFIMMLAMVLSANIFADAVRDAFDPRSRVSKSRKRSALQIKQAGSV